MKSINILSESARGIASYLFETSPNHNARDYADALDLIDASVLEIFGWERNARSEASIFFEELADYTAKVSNTEVEINGRKETFKYAAEDCGISGWEEDICAAAICGDNIERKVDHIAERIMNSYDARGVMSFIRI